MERIARRYFRGDGVITGCQRFQKPLADLDLLCRGVFDICAGTDDWSNHPADNSSVASRDPKCTMKGRILFSEREVSNFAAAPLSALPFGPDSSDTWSGPRFVKGTT